MRTSTLLAAPLLLLVATEASASRYAWCEVSAQVGSNEYIDYLSEIVEIEEGTEAYLAFRDGPFSIEFSRHVYSSLDNRARDRDCRAANSLREANKAIDLKIFANPNHQVIRTGWTGGRPVAVDGGEEATRPEPGIIIGSAGSASREVIPGNSRAATRQRASDDAARLASQSQRAATMAQAAAEAAKNNAEIQAKIAKMKEDMRKRCGGPSKDGTKGACAQ